MDEQEFLADVVRTKMGADMSYMDAAKFISIARAQFRSGREDGTEEEERARFREAFLSTPL